MTPVMSLSRLITQPWQQGEFFGGSDVSLGALLGLKALGITYSEVPPGRSGCPFHCHHVEDELFVILEGQGEYRFGQEHHPVTAGDVLGAPAGGRETAHQLINTGDRPLQYLAISSMASADIIEYPDSGKFMARADGADRRHVRLLGRHDDMPAYWEGEPGE
ncbi:cupin domain-containing protein [Kushneria sp. AK178]